MKIIMGGLLIAIALHTVISAENLLVKDPNWWKEFVQNVPAQITMPIVSKPVVPDPLLIPEDQSKSWFEKNKSDVFYCASLLAIGYCGYIFGKWVKSSKGALLHKMLDLHDKMNDPNNPAIRNAVNGGNVNEVKKLVRDFEIDHPMLAAINANYQCCVCLDIIIDPNLFGIGSNNCFHFVCTACKKRMANSAMSNRFLCPGCRRP